MNPVRNSPPQRPFGPACRQAGVQSAGPVRNSRDFKTNQEIQKRQKNTKVSNGAGAISNGMKILAIETSCDETAIALVAAEGGLKSPRFKVLANLVASQIPIHRPWGGVVPSLAKREHLKNLPILFRKIIKKTHQLNLVTVTVGPGLEPCLWTGIDFAKEIQKKYFPQAKLTGVSHLNGHLYSFLLKAVPLAGGFGLNSKIFPAVALIVSGGHTILLLMESLVKYKKLGETRDDAAGETFDKVGRMLKLPFPGGPEIEKTAVLGNATAINFPRPMITSKNYDFSFSGLKTSVLYYLRDHLGYNRNDIAASFQQAAIDVLVAKTKKAAENFKAKSIILAGGVAANKKLRQSLRKTSRQLKINFFCPLTRFNTDNAAMIAAAAYVNFLRKKNLALRTQPNLNF